VRNLLDNAIRYSPPGGTIIIQIKNHDGQVELAVSDQGPGIAPPALEHVFERFYRGNTAPPTLRGEAPPAPPPMPFLPGLFQGGPRESHG
jgi:signal transduction histidine kinase